MLRGKLFNMKLFIDDLRDPPNDTWTVVRTGREAIEATLRKIYNIKIRYHTLVMMIRK
jgi:hypothetical protein